LAVKYNFGLERLRLRGRGGRKSFDGLDTCNSGRDEVVKVVGRENGTHGAGCFVEELWMAEEEE
jgi:hypothetical protein